MRILISVRSMWGSVEWILPVCRHLKEKYQDAEVSFIFMREDSQEIFGENKDLEEVFKKYVNEYFDYKSLLPGISRALYVFFDSLFRWSGLRLFKFLKDFWFKLNWKIVGKRAIRKYVRCFNADVCLADNQAYIDELRSDKAKVGFFLTAPSFSFSPEVWIDKEKQNKTWNKFDFDFYLVDTDWTKDYFEGRVNGKPVFKVGTPKFDTAWIEFLKGKDTQENIIVVLLKNKSCVLFEEIDFEELLRNILDECVKYQDMKILLKPHPRQEMRLLKRIMDSYNNKNLLITYEPTYSLVNKSKIVISMPSGIIFDVLIMNRPVIEFFNYKILNKILREKYGAIPKNALGGMSFLDEQGDLTSVFRGKNFVLKADTSEELRSLMADILMKDVQNSNNPLMREFYPDFSCERVTKKILEMAKKN